MIGALVEVVTALALIVGVVTALCTGALRVAVRVLLDLLTAAGLLRLAGDPQWGGLAVAAAIVALRQLLAAALSFTPPWSRPTIPATLRGRRPPLSVGGSSETGKAGG
ncbi:hypothetical protein ACGFIE_08080 [Micromonospora sp. NPDC049275]|uniref:hypothetical protein n=1 Tax=Micromonospora sp. NPDC049275 TaxID=3364268 RepID=UPI0037234177